MLTDTDDDVTYTWWAMDEVPRLERMLLTLDDQQCLAGEEQEVLLSASR